MGVKDSIEATKDHISRAIQNAPSNIGKGSGPAEDVTYPDGHFDTVLMSTILSYVKDPQQAVKEAFRILKPAGAT